MDPNPIYVKSQVGLHEAIPKILVQKICRVYPPTGGIILSNLSYAFKFCIFCAGMLGSCFIIRIIFAYSKQYYRELFPYKEFAIFWAFPLLYSKLLYNSQSSFLFIYGLI